MIETPVNLLQRIARSVLVGLCGAMAVGLVGAVTVRAMDNSGSPASTTTATPENISLAVERVQSVELLSATPTAASAGKGKRVIEMEVTGYCACSKCCGPAAKGITASGKTIRHNDGKFVAADTRVLPFGTKLVIPGYAGGKPVEVIDRGGAIKGNKLDLHFATHSDALKWGRQKVAVTIYE